MIVKSSTRLCLVLIFLSLTACHEPESLETTVVRAPVTGKTFFAGGSAKSEIQGLCSELKSIGKMTSIRKLIDADMEEVRVRLTKEDLIGQRERFLFLSERIMENTNLLIQMVDHRFVGPEVQQKMRWDVRAAELGIKNDAGWRIGRVSAEKVISAFGEDQDLRKILKIEHNQKNLSVRFERLASPLELCQLQQAIAIHIRVEFRNQHGDLRVSHFKLLGRNAGG